MCFAFLCWSMWFLIHQHCYQVVFVTLSKTLVHGQTLSKAMILIGCDLKVEHQVPSLDLVRTTRRETGMVTTCSLRRAHQEFKGTRLDFSAKCIHHLTVTNVLSSTTIWMVQTLEVWMFIFCWTRPQTRSLRSPWCGPYRVTGAPTGTGDSSISQHHTHKAHLRWVYVLYRRSILNSYFSVALWSLLFVSHI